MLTEHARLMLLFSSTELELEGGFPRRTVPRMRRAHCVKWMRPRAERKNVFLAHLLEMREDKLAGFRGEVGLSVLASFCDDGKLNRDQVKFN